MPSAKSKSRTRRGPSPETEARQAEIELAVETIDDTPDYAAFLARWGDRYSDTNLARLWVQCPQAVALHKVPTWRGMGRSVRKGEKAVWLRIPHTSHDDEKITEANPSGEVFHGAPWMALFDYSQTIALGDDFTEEADPGTDPDLVAEVKRLRMEASAAHPDNGGTAEGFMAAWKRYTSAQKLLKKETGHGAYSATRPATGATS